MLSALIDLSLTMSTTTPEPSPSPTYDLQLTDFLEGASGQIMFLGGALLILVGVMAIVWGGAKAVSKIMRYQEYGDSWLKVFSMFVIGGVFTTAGWWFIGYSRSPDLADGESPDATASPMPSAEPSSVATPPPVAEPVEPQTWSLPKVENLETLWFVLGGIVVLIAVGIVLSKVVAANGRRRLAEAQQQALQLKIDARWAAVVGLHQQIKAAYLHAETDWDMLFRYPALQDVAVPTTGKFVRLFVETNRTDATRPTALGEIDDLKQYPYAAAVYELDHAWQAAVSFAKKTGQNQLTRQERRELADIRQLLDIAENTGASDNERRTAYRVAQSKLAKLGKVHVPERAFQALEARAQLMLEAVVR